MATTLSRAHIAEIMASMRAWRQLPRPLADHV